MRRKQRILLGIISFVLCSCILFAFRSGSGLALRRMMAEPRRIGMIAPSSRALYKRMAKEVLPADIEKEGLVVELGPGTGVGTQVLLERGVSPERLLCVELDPELHKYMTKKFPQVRTILGNAANLAQILGENSGKITAIVSSIPLTNLSKEQATAIVSACHTVLKPQGRMTQVTYRMRPTLTVPGFERSYGGFILFNLPPAFVWTLTKVE